MSVRKNMYNLLVMSVFLLGLPGYAGGQTADNPIPADGARYVDPEVQIRGSRGGTQMDL